YLSPSDIFLLPKLRQTTTAVKPSRPLPPDSNQMASAIPGAIHFQTADALGFSERGLFWNRTDKRK
ncbi:hypothetical protein BJN45_17145, partial [Azonexus hydrophilus]